MEDSKLFEKVLSNSLIDESYEGLLNYIQKVEELIYKHFSFLFSEKFKEASDKDLANFDRNINSFHKEYLNMKNILKKEMNRIYEAQNSTGILDPEKVNNNVNIINLRIKSFQIIGDTIGKEINKINNDINKLINAINAAHGSLPKNPSAPIRLIKPLKNKFKT